MDIGMCWCLTQIQTKGGGSKTAYLFKCMLFGHVTFSPLQECTNSVHLRRWVVLEPYATSTSKIHNYFYKAPQNMKQLGLDAKSLSFKENLLKNISRSFT